MNLNEFKLKSKENFETTCCSENINGTTIPNTQTLKILIRKLEELNAPNWKFSNSEIIFNKDDFRFQLWAKFDLYTLYYYQNIKLTIDNYENLIDESLDLGYSLAFSSHSLLYKEVYERTNFLSKFYFDLEHFIQQVNKEINFINSNSSKKKSHYFKELINELELPDYFNINDAINDINRIFGDKLLKNVPDKKVEYHLFFDYLTSYRNSFHNNGFAQRNLNRLNFGGIILETKKEKQVTLNHAVVFVLIYVSILIFEKITKKLMDKYPTVWKDKYIQDVNEFLKK